MGKLNMKTFFITLFSATFMMSCFDLKPQPSDMVGKYIVSAELKAGTIDKESIKKEIDEAMAKAGEEIETSRKEMMEDIDLESIDTTTVEGKIEYLGKSLGAQVGNLGLDIGKISKDFGALVGDLASGSIDLSTAFLKNFKIEIELQEDGDIKVKNRLVSMGFNDGTWKVENGEFVLMDESGKEKDRFKIKDRSSDSFVLEKDELLLTFTKQK